MARDGRPLRWFRRLLLGCSMAAATSAGAAPADPAASPESDVVGKVYIEPQVIDRPPIKFPRDQQRAGKDGWVLLSLMVDKAGNPLDPVVADSSGNRAFEKAALEAVEHWRFEAATLGGEPTEGAYRAKLVFSLEGPGGNGASNMFAAQYRAAVKAIKRGDRAAADTALADMRARSLYEESYLWIARFSYRQVWGTPAEQLAALEQAIAYESSATYLPADLFTNALQHKFQLEVKTNKLADALETWKVLREQELPDQAREGYRKMVDEIEQLQTDGRSFAVADSIDEDGFRALRLLKSRFRLAVTSGSVKALVLDCDRQRRALEVDSALQYVTSAASGQCYLRVLGDPGTQFSVIQS